MTLIYTISQLYLRSRTWVTMLYLTMFCIVVGGCVRTPDPLGKYSFGWDETIQGKTVTLTPHTTVLDLKPNNVYVMTVDKKSWSGKYTLKDGKVYMVVPGTSKRAWGTFKNGDIYPNHESFGFQDNAGANARYVKQEPGKKAFFTEQ